jgi:ABC-type phosphate transport system substrate-binding protein
MTTRLLQPLPVSATLAAVLAAALGLAGCSDDTSGKASSDATTVEVTIKGSSVEPVAKKVDIGVGGTITVKVDSDRAGELHVHSTPEQTFDFKAGTSSYDVTLDKPGTVDIEEHVSDTVLIRALVS